MINMRMMTTPVFTFSNLKTDPRQLAVVEMAFAQLEISEKPILLKIGSELTMTEDSVSVMLTQEETRLFDPGTCLNIQLRGLSKDGKVTSSKVFCADIDPALSDKVLKLEEG